MKLLFAPIIITCLLSSCGEEKKRTADTSKQSAPHSGSAAPASADKRAAAPRTSYVAGDSVPPMETLGEGKFSQKGLADAFQNAVGWPMPDYVKPVEGAYTVWNEKDFGGRNRSHHTATFTFPKEKAAALADEIENTWRKKFGQNRDFEIGRSQLDRDYTEGNQTVHKGTIVLGICEKYARYKTNDFSISIDPVAGQFSLRSYRGTEDTPAEREKPDAQ